LLIVSLSSSFCATQTLTQVVAGDTLLDVALRNRKSTTVLACLRAMGAPTANCHRRNAWLLEGAARQVRAR
jgi:hypothetical protein